MTITYPRTDYVGAVPDFKYFDGLDPNGYKHYCKSYKGKSWDLKHETIKYCLQDCIVLHQILSKFSEEVTSTLGVSLKNTPFSCS